MTQDEEIEFHRLKTARDSLMLLVANLRGQLETIAADECEECAKMVDHILKEGGGTYGDAIRARSKYD